MAGIDKTYCKSYKEYKSFYDWSENKYITFFNNHKEYIRDYIWLYEEEDFINGEIAIMNTPTFIDIYLIQNCKIEFVLDRMKQVYSRNYHILENIDLKSIDKDRYKQNRKITITSSQRTSFKRANNPHGYSKWWLENLDNMVYHEETNIWSDKDMYYPYNTTVASIKSIKSIIRHLRKQYLPTTTFRISGGIIGEEYLIKVL